MPQSRAGGQLYGYYVITKVGEAYRRLIEQWRVILPTESFCLQSCC